MGLKVNVVDSSVAVVSRVWLLVHYPYLLIWTETILIEPCS